jgi:hypothetical protein
VTAQSLRIVRAAVAMLLLSGGVWHAVHTVQAYSRWMDIYVSEQPETGSSSYTEFGFELAMSIGCFLLILPAWRKLTF